MLHLPPSLALAAWSPALNRVTAATGPDWRFAVTVAVAVGGTAEA